MSSPPTTTTPRRPRRASKFTEGSEFTRPDFSSLTPETASPLLIILSEMDSWEAAHNPTPNRPRHQQQGSNSSVESFASTNSSNTPKNLGFGTNRDRSGSGSESLSGNGNAERDVYAEKEFQLQSQSPPKEGRRSINFVRRSLDERPREFFGAAEGGKLASKFKGRLRALTGGRSGDVNH